MGSQSALSGQSDVDEGFPPPAMIRDAYRIVDNFAPAIAKPLLQKFIDATCSGVLGGGDRSELLESILASRQGSPREFLEGSGLLCDPAVPGEYLPGSWHVRVESSDSECRFVIYGVRRASGDYVAVRLTVAQFMCAAATLRAVRKAVGAGEHTGPTATQWRRIWQGFAYKEYGRVKHRTKGLRRILLEMAEGRT